MEGSIDEDREILKDVEEMWEYFRWIVFVFFVR